MGDGGRVTMSQHGVLTYREISAQPEALAAALDEVKRRKEDILRFRERAAQGEVLFIGSGSSYYQAQTMAATVRKWTGLSARALPSSELYLFREHHASVSKPCTVVGVSRSGESSEVILALESVQNLPGWNICGVTCHETSALYRMAPCLLSPLGKEQSTVMTKSFSSMTYMVQAAAAVASEQAEHYEQIVEAGSLSADVTRKADAFAKKLTENPLYTNYLFLGMGAYFGLAQEACLKLKEMSYVWTESFGTMEFRHGPKSVVEKGSFVCVLVSERARSHELKVAEEMKQYGATVLLVTAKAGEDTAFADHVFETGGESLSDEARSVLYLPLLQYFGYYTAMKKGVDPDHPRNLTQVVKI